MNVAYEEDAWLDRLVGKPCFCFLGSGVCLRGRLIGHDRCVIFLGPEDSQTRGTSQMIYKGFIATIQPWSECMDSLHKHSIRI
jgi:sRNA-binding regulator protein Hfq